VRQVFHNLGVASAAAGSDFSRIVKLTVYLTDLDDLGVFRRSVTNTWIRLHHRRALWFR
jgi:enamine deaminase RidA (YjgF/YER057c/UK114 family)